MWPRTFDLQDLTSAEQLDLLVGLTVASVAIPVLIFRNRATLPRRQAEKWLEVVILLLLSPVTRSRLTTYFVSRQFFLRGYKKLLLYVMLGILVREAVDIQPAYLLRAAEVVSFAAMYVVSKDREKKRISIFLKASMGWPLSVSAMTGTWTFFLLMVLQMGCGTGFFPGGDYVDPFTVNKRLALPGPILPRRSMRPCICPGSLLHASRRETQISLSALSKPSDVLGTAVTSSAGVTWALSVLEPLSLIHI